MNSSSPTLKHPRGARGFELASQPDLHRGHRGRTQCIRGVESWSSHYNRSGVKGKGCHPKKQLQKLREAGLYVRNPENDGAISGGGWREVVDPPLSGVQNGFVIIPMNNEIYNVVVVDDCQRDAQRHLSLEEAVNFLIKNVETSPMTHERAVAKLRAAGLHVRDLGEDGIIGGSHVDRSGVVGMVQNSFMLKRVQNGDYEVEIHEAGVRVTLSLDRAVPIVLHLVTPQPDIEAPPPRPGPQEY